MTSAPRGSPRPSARTTKAQVSPATATAVEAAGPEGVASPTATLRAAKEPGPGPDPILEKILSASWKT